MGSRIVHLEGQRRLRELGRIRTGVSEPYMKDGKERRRPVRSEVFILTSAHRDYLDAAAQLWGGTVDRWQPQGAGPEVWRLVTEAGEIEAELLPGDPIDEAYEMWSRGGCVRRCDGQTERLANKPCLCIEQWGDEWHERDDIPLGQACKITHRLSVALPLTDFGTWRLECHSYYAAVELTGAVDLIRALVGNVRVSVRLAIEPRSRMRRGKLAQYQVVAMRLGAATQQILAGVAPTRALEAGVERPAITGGQAPAPVAAPAPPAQPQPPTPAPDGAGQNLPTTPAGWAEWVRTASGTDELTAMWRVAGQAGAVDETLKAVFAAVGAVLKAREAAEEVEQEDMLDPTGEAQVPVGGTVTVGGVEFVKHSPDPFGEPGPTAPPEPSSAREPDRVTVWQRILSLGHAREWTTTAVVEQHFTETMGRPPKEADGWTMVQFAEHLEQEGVPV